MIELYKNSSDREITFSIPVDITPIGAVDIVIKHRGEPIYTVNTVVVNGEKYTFKVPFNLLTFDRNFETYIKFDYLEDGQLFTYEDGLWFAVSTPILPLNEIKDILGPTATDDEVKRAEIATRYIIQAYCGQSFGKFIGTKTVYGKGEPNLRLPSRLIRLNSVNTDTYWAQAVAVRGNGWWLALRNKTWPSVKEDAFGFHYNPTTGLSNPMFPRINGFYCDSRYVIDGVWGWEAVPAAVAEAARILIADYACSDSIYRDRYISSVTSIDWKIIFDSGAFIDTGNVKANQLLSNYIVYRGWEII